MLVFLVHENSMCSWFTPVVRVFLDHYISEYIPSSLVVNVILVHTCSAVFLVNNVTVVQVFLVDIWYPCIPVSQLWLMCS
jgi:hypothetical protein